MTDSRDYEIGYGRPPLHSRWKPGQCGNPRRRRGRRSRGAIELIDAAFQRKVRITLNGKQQYVSVLEAIIMQLWSKEMQGDRRALATRLKYVAFAAKGIKRDVVVEYEYQMI